jgi:hypothetical protein
MTSNVQIITRPVPIADGGQPGELERRAVEVNYRSSGHVSLFSTLDGDGWRPTNRPDAALSDLDDATMRVVRRHPSRAFVVDPRVLEHL